MSAKAKEKKYAYMSIITNDSYLPGLLVLFRTLIETKPKYPFLTLVTSSVSPEVISIIKKNGISYKIVDKKIDNPTNIHRNHRWFLTYSKLNIFNQIQFDKIVYLDADMLIIRNIDELFKYDHMSAVIAGGLIPGKSLRRQFNSGLMVIQPSGKVFEDMINKIGKIEKLEIENSDKPKQGSDQDFLNAYYSDWPNKKNLHLDHKYNIIHYLLDEYNKLFGYSINQKGKTISVIHYASYLKPWNINKKTINNLKKDYSRSEELESIKLWQEKYRKIKFI